VGVIRLRRRKLGESRNLKGDDQGTKKTLKPNERKTVTRNLEGFPPDIQVRAKIGSRRSQKAPDYKCSRSPVSREGRFEYNARREKTFAGRGVTRRP